MNGALVFVGLAALEFVGILLGLELGRRIRRRERYDGDGGGPAVGAVFGLLGLLLAFTFTGAAARFDHRRHFAVDEANAIGTAWRRLDLLPADDQPALRAKLRDYLDARMVTHQALPDVQRASAAMARASALQRDIWTLAVASVRRGERSRLVTMVLSPLNDMFEVARSRLTAVRTHVPFVILALLFVFALVASVVAGHSMDRGAASRRLHPLVFAGIMSVTLYVILDLEFPRAGFIRIRSDPVMMELRQSFDEPVPASP